MEELRLIRSLYGREHIRALFLLAFISNTLILAPSAHMMQMYNRVLTSQSIETLVYITLICVCALAFYGITEAARGRVAQRLATSYGLAISDKLFSTFAGVDSTPAQSGQNLRDFQLARSFLASRGFTAMFDLPFVPFYLLVLALVHWTIGLLTLGGAAGLAVLAYLNSTASAAGQKQSRNAEAEAMAVAQSTLARSEDVNSLGLLPNLRGWWMKKSEEALGAADEVARQSSNYYGYSRGMRQGLQVLLMAWTAFLVVKGEMSGGLIFLASMVSGKALAPLEALIGGWDGLTKARAAFMSVEKALGAAPDIASRPRLPEPKGHLSVQNLVVMGDGSAEAGKPVIDNVSLAIRPGELVAIVGLSGSGKSLLARAMAGGIPIESGLLRLDGAAREQWPDEQWGGAVGYVDQETDLFPGTVAANVARFEANVSANRIYEAAQRAGVYDILLALPDGFRTRIGEGGKRLSSGQRKAVALARAFYGNPKILIFDQPTLSLDPAMESRFVASLASAKAAGTALIVISQRGAIIELADRAFILRDGKLQQMKPNAEGAAVAATGAAAQKTAPSIDGGKPERTPTNSQRPSIAVPVEKNPRRERPKAAAELPSGRRAHV